MSRKINYKYGKKINYSYKRDKLSYKYEWENKLYI